MSIGDLAEGSGPDEPARVGVVIARSVLAGETAGAGVVAVAQQMVEPGETQLAAALRNAHGDPSEHLLDTIVGPFHDAPGVARLLGVTVPTVQQLAGRNHLLGCPTAEGELVFPTFQFDADGAAMTGLAGVLAAFGEGTSDRWQVALWLSTPSDELGGQAPRDAVNQGLIEPVRLLALRTAARWRL